MATESSFFLELPGDKDELGVTDAEAEGSSEGVVPELEDGVFEEVGRYDADDYKIVTCTI